jgi:ATP-dependent Zn protease
LMSHLERSREEMLLGTERKSFLVPEEDRKLTAYHEGGHALTALYSEHATPLHKATIIPRGSALGLVSQIPDKDELSASKQALLARVDVAMGGRVAEELIFGADMVTTGASSDFAQASRIARSMVTQFGMSDLVGPLVIDENSFESLGPDLKSLIDSETKRILEESKSRVWSLLQKRRNQLELLAAALLEHETLSKEEIQLAVAGKPITSKITDSKSSSFSSSTCKDQDQGIERGFSIFL